MHFLEYLLALALILAHSSPQVVALEKVKAAGYAATPTDTVQTVLGRPATSFAEFLAASATN